MPTPTTLDSLQQRRVQIADQIAALGDLRSGSITPTSGRCGKPTCHCHRPNDPGHGPNPRLTFKVEGKTVTQSLPNPAAVHKAEREIAEFRNLQVLHKEFVEVNGGGRRGGKRDEVRRNKLPTVVLNAFFLPVCDFVCRRRR